MQTVLRRRILAAAMLLNKERKYKKRKYWVSDFLYQRKMNGAYYMTIPELDFDSFVNYCRMNRTQLQFLRFENIKKH